MDLPVEAIRVTGSESPITIWDSKRLNSWRRGNAMFPYLQQAIDEMGKGSKTAQGLNAVLTSVNKLFDNPNQRLYLLCTGKQCVGLIKVGPKKLFVRTKTGQLHEIDPLCVLDFYVHESAQRTGYGKQLYDTMVEREEVKPSQLGYDRPSPKFLSFLRKHFSLSDYVPQSNNFVVFAQYFEGNHSNSRNRGRSNDFGSPFGGGGGHPATANSSNNSLQSRSYGGHSTAASSVPYQVREEGNLNQTANGYHSRTANSMMSPSQQQQQNSLRPSNSAAPGPGMPKGRGRSSSPYAYNDAPTPSSSDFSGRPSGPGMGSRGGHDAAAGGFPPSAGGRAPLSNQMPPRSQVVNSAPTIGLSSSCYPGGGHGPRPAGSHELSRTAGGGSSRSGVNTSQVRERSPTRSGSNYDIITGGAGGSVGGTPAMSYSGESGSRPMGRKSTRPF